MATQEQMLEVALQAASKDAKSVGDWLEVANRHSSGVESLLLVPLISEARMLEVRISAIQLARRSC